MERTCVVDIECNRFKKDKEIVFGHYRTNQDTYDFNTKELQKAYIPLLDEQWDWICGHNIKFDMKYLMNTSEYVRDKIYKQFESGMVLWDTQTVEYLGTGHQTKMIGLRKLSVEGYKLPERLKLMEEYWNKEIDTKDIPLEIISQDCRIDVNETAHICQEQQAEITKQQLKELVQLNGKAMNCTLEMEYRGMALDLDFIEDYKKQRTLDLAEKEREIQKLITEYWTLPIPFTMNSNDHLSLLLFGGKVSVNIPELVGLNKCGTFKYKKNLHDYVQQGLIPNYTGEKVKKPGYFKVNADILDKLDHPLCKLIVTKREQSKLLATYINNFIENSQNGILYSNLNHCVTNTGRLSSSGGVNLQNIPKNEIRRAFISRYKNGTLLEFDYKSIEPRVIAHLSQDPILIEELNNKIDLYTDNAPLVYKTKDITKEQRHVMKCLVLGVFYDKWSKSFAVETGLSEKVCQKFIDGFYEKYAEVKKWHNKLIEEIKLSKNWVGYGNTSTGQTLKKVIMPTAMGGLITFYQSESLAGNSYWKNSEIFNYYVQNMAGDLLKRSLGNIFDYWLQYRDQFVLINTVHDSIIVDTKYGLGTENLVVDNVINPIKKVLEFKETVEFPVEVKAGVNWFDMIEVK